MRRPFSAEFSPGLEYGSVISHSRTESYATPDEFWPIVPMGDGVTPPGYRNLLQAAPEDYDVTDVTMDSVSGSGAIFEVDVPGTDSGVQSSMFIFVDMSENHEISLTLTNMAALSRDIRVELGSYTRAGVVDSTDFTDFSFTAGEERRVTLGHMPTTAFGIVRILARSAGGWLAGEQFAVTDARVDLIAVSGELDFYFYRADGGLLRDEDLAPSPNATTMLPFGFYGGAIEGYSWTGRTAWRMHPGGTNLVPNPFGISTSSRTAVNAAGSTSTESILADACYVLTATGANATDRQTHTLGNNAEYSFIAIVQNMTALDQIVQLVSDGSIVATDTVPPGHWRKLEIGITGDGTSNNYDVRWPDSVNTDVFRTHYLGIIFSSSMKTYPVPDLSLINDNINSTYGSWAGTAHNSVSTRADRVMAYDTLAAQGKPPICTFEQGSVYIRFADVMPYINPAQPILPGYRTLLSLDDKIKITFGLDNELTFEYWAGVNGTDLIIAIPFGVDILEGQENEYGAAIMWAGSQVWMTLCHIPTQVEETPVSGTLPAVSHSGAVAQICLGNDLNGSQAAGCLGLQYLFSNRIFLPDEIAKMNSNVYSDINGLRMLPIGKIDVRKIRSNRMIVRAVESGIVDV